MLAYLTTRNRAARRITAALMALVAIGVGAIGVAAPAVAQAPAHQPSPAAVLLAKQIVQLKGDQDVFKPIVVGVVEKTKQLIMQTNFMWQKDIDAVAVDLHKEFDPRVNELVEATARIYASHFTEQELKDLLAFYQSPLGQKELAEEPQVLNESMVFAGNWADNLAQEVMSKMRLEMKKRGHDI